jgi:hypothetical protein
MKTGTKQLRVWDVTHSTGKTSSHPITRSAEHPLGRPSFSLAPASQRRTRNKMKNYQTNPFHILHLTLHINGLRKNRLYSNCENEPILNPFSTMNSPFTSAIKEIRTATIIINITISKQATYNKRPSFRVLFPVDGGTERPLSFFHDRAVA